MKKYFQKKWSALCLVVLMVMAMATNAFAGVTTPTSLLDAGVVTIINDFAADLKPTVLDLIGIIIPVGLALWAIGFGIKKGLAFLQRRAQRTV